MLKIRQSFFEHPNKITQDNILASYMEIKEPKRKRSRKQDGKSHNFSVNYFVSSHFKVYFKNSIKLLF